MNTFYLDINTDKTILTSFDQFKNKFNRKKCVII